MMDYWIEVLSMNGPQFARRAPLIRKLKGKGADVVAFQPLARRRLSVLVRHGGF